MDFLSVFQAVQGLPEAFDRVVDINDRRAELLVKGVARKSPIVCFITLQMTNVGHSLPEICGRGFEWLKIVAEGRHYDHLMECLFRLSPLFFDDPQALESITAFQDVISIILAADQSIFKMAREFVSNETPGPVMREFGNMIHRQIRSFQRYACTLEFF